MSASSAWGAAGEARRRSAHERVEIACPGGVGRTGTALAAIAMADGMNAGEAVAWVRRNYHPALSRHRGSGAGSSGRSFDAIERYGASPIT